MTGAEATTVAKGARLLANSCGAGVQSTTLVLLAIEGVLPKPDVSLFADTGWEPPGVYAHLDRLETAMTEAGMRLERVGPGHPVAVA